MKRRNNTLLNCRKICSTSGTRRNVIRNLDVRKTESNCPCHGMNGGINCSALEGVWCDAMRCKA